MLRRVIMLMVVLVLAGCSATQAGGEVLDARGQWSLYYWKATRWVGPVKLIIKSGEGGGGGSLRGTIVDVRGNEAAVTVVLNGENILMTTRKVVEDEEVVATYSGKVEVGGKMRGKATDTTGKTVNWFAERH